MTTQPQIDTRAAFNAMHAGSNRTYHANLAVLRNRTLSGVYALIQAGQVVYVGESHSGRLYDTITRHFRRWRVDPTRDAQGRRRGGTTYDRHATRVAYLVTPAADAAQIQYAEIQRLNPRDNINDGSSTDAGDLPI